MAILRVLLAGAALLGASISLADSPLDESVSFDIREQPLESALFELSKQSSYQIVFTSGSLPDRKAPAVSGTMQVRQALNLLLSGTDLGYKLVGDRTITVGREAQTVGSTDTKALQLAQAGNNDAKPVAQADQAAGTQDVLQEIVVTAQKRTERLQDVPSSISVLSSQDIKRKGIVSMDDFMRSVPGTYRMEKSSGRNNPIVIRGLTTAPDTGSPAVGLYFGEVPLQSSLDYGDAYGTADLSLVDMQRVEVLKGPQGTLYGSGALAGIVREQPAEPDLREFSGKVAAGYSNTGTNGDNNYLANGVVNLPLVQDKFAVRLVGYRSSDGGYAKNVAASGGAGRPSGTIQAGAFGASLVDEDHQGQVDRVGGRLTALWQPVDAFKASYMFVRQEVKQDGAPEVNLSLGTYEQSFIQVGHTSPRGAGYDNTVTINNLVLDYGFSGAQLMSSTSWIDTESEFLRDLVWAGLGPTSQLGHGIFNEFSEEVRLTSKLDGPFQYLVGGFYEDTKLHANIPGPGIIRWEGDPAQAANFYVTNFGATPAQPQTDQYLPIIADQGDGRRAEVRQKSFFGELSYELRQGLKATVGARRFTYDSVQKNWPNYFPVFNNLGGGPVEELSSSESGNVFKAALSYKPNEDALLYGQWSQGFRLGGPLAKASGNCDLDGDGLATIVLPDGRQVTGSRFLESDRTDNFEIGGKFSLLNRRASIQASVYSIDWDKIPINVFNSTASCVAQVNAGKARSQGMEIETDFLFGAGFSTHIGLSYVNVELTTDPGALGVKGDRLPGSPRFSGNAALNYDFSLSGHETYVRGDLMYVGTFYNNLQQLGTAAGGYYQLNLRSGVTYGSANLDFYINNVTNNDGLTWIDGAIIADARAWRLRPRTVGMQLTWNF